MSRAMGQGCGAGEERGAGGREGAAKRERAPAGTGNGRVWPGMSRGDRKMHAEPLRSESVLRDRARPARAPPSGRPKEARAPGSRI